MDTACWSGFLVYVIITAFTPGPNNLLSLGNAGTFGLRASVPMLLGLGTSFVALMGLCGLATATLAELLPVVMPPLRIVGAAYILWLAYGLARSGAPEGTTRGRACTFRQAFVLQFVNIKVILYGLTSFTTFVLTRTQDPWHIVGVALLLAFAGNAANWAWAAAGQAFHGLFATHGRLINGLLALLLAYSVLDLF